MKKLIIFFLAVSLFAACNNKKDPKDDRKDDPKDEKTSDVKEDKEKPKDEEKISSTWSSLEINAYVNNCIPAAEKNGLTKGQATDYCECTQRGLEKMYPDPKDVAGLDLNAPNIQEMIIKCNPLD
jgi:hypothetical protein